MSAARKLMAQTIRQQALVCELHAYANRLDQLLLTPIFGEGQDFAEGQANSCLIVALQQLNTVIQMIFDMGESGVLHPRSLVEATAHDPVFPELERRGKSRGKRGLEANAETSASVDRLSVARRVVTGGAE